MSARIVLATMAAQLAMLGGIAVAQHAGHRHPPQHAALHEKFYSTWMRPDMPGISCCNLEDCYPAPARLIDGHWHAQRREDGEWLRIPDEKVERNKTSPDGNSHMCAPPPDKAKTLGLTVFCFILGGGA